MKPSEPLPLALRGLGTLLFASLLFAHAALAQIYIDIHGPSARAFPLAIDDPTILEGTIAALAPEIDAGVRERMDNTGLFKIIDTKAHLEGPEAGIREGSFRWEDWEVSGAAALVKIGYSRQGNRILAEVRVYDIAGRSSVGGKVVEADASTPRVLADRIADAAYSLLTGSDPMFDSLIVAIASQNGSKELVLLDSSGKQIRALTHDQSIALSPAWWPKGDAVCFTSFRRDDPDLYRWSGGSLTVLSDRPGIDSGCAVRPDGKRLAVSRYSGGDADLYLLDPDGSNPTRLTRAWGIDVSPSWSPDGTQLAFVSGRNGFPTVFILSTQSGETRQLTKAGKHNVAPDWSPDGDRIVFSARDEGRFDIFVVNVDGSGLRRLTQSKGNDEDPSWAPNGRYLVFVSDRTGTKELWMVDDDGRHEVQLTHGGSYSNPDWGPLLGTP